VATMAPTQEPHCVLPPLQAPLWQLLTRAHGAPTGLVPGVLLAGRNPRSRLLHDSAASSATEAVTPARLVSRPTRPEGV
jgi:hypothetical protein